MRAAFGLQRLDELKRKSEMIYPVFARFIEMGIGSIFTGGESRFRMRLDALTAYPDREVDTFINWLDDLDPPAEPIDYDRLGTWFQEVGLFPTDPDNPVTRWAQEFLLLGAIQRAFEPGCALHQSPVFMGKPGIGKSSLIGHLLPAGENRRDRWYSERFRIVEDDAEMIRQTRGRGYRRISGNAGDR